MPANAAPVPSAVYSRPRLGAVLSAIAQRTPLRIAHLVGENQNRVDDPPDDRTEPAGHEPDDELGDAETDLAEIHATDAHDPEKPEQLQQTGDHLRFVRERLTRQRVTTERRARILIGLRVLARRWRILRCIAGLRRRRRWLASKLVATELRFSHDRQHARTSCDYLRFGRSPGAECPRDR